MKFLQLKFIPQSADFGLLLLRVVAGLTLLLNHGWGKVMNFNSYSEKFLDFLGLGSTVSLSLMIFAEVVCAALITVGWLTRFAALVIAIGMGVAFFVGHGMKLSNPGSGELALIYMVVAATLFFSGPGKISVDSKQGAA
ncbi:MAG: DoxX family protein [Opitutaceae bacterium]|nr:DoxX family protein [Opitutaceae bacterium]